MKKTKTEKATKAKSPDKDNNADNIVIGVCCVMISILLWVIVSSAISSFKTSVIKRHERMKEQYIECVHHLHTNGNSKVLENICEAVVKVNNE